MSRPESTGHAAHFYNEKEARKYHSSSRMISVQREITERALELMRLSSDDNNKMKYILDVGCGSGLSGQVLEEYGHAWVGMDISRDMLTVAKEKMDATTIAKEANMQEDSDDEEEEDEGPSTGTLIHHDMGTGLPFREATFDGCISISALQWLCYSNSKGQVPKRRLTRFFSSLYSVLKKHAKAVLQFYPETAEQAVLIAECATAVGFSGGVVVDYPNSAKAKKHYLVLSADRVGHSSHQQGMSAALQARQQDHQVQVGHVDPKNKNKKMKPIRKKKGGVKTKEWILHKKEHQRKKGKTVRPDTKYTARRRPTKF